MPKFLIYFNLFICIIGTGINATIHAQPSQVLIIRHAEKPKDDSRNDLSKKGIRRAKKLVSFFKTTPSVTELGTPQAIYAMNNSSPTSSIRAIQTVTPLALSLNIQVLTPYTRDEIKPLVSEIMSKTIYKNKMVLICWEHNMINNMADLFGVNDSPKWADKDFDSIYKIDFNSKGTVSKFSVIHQNIDVHKNSKK